MESIEFGRLYERYASDVMRFALFLTGSRAEAQDITSETFVRAWVDSDRIRVGTVKAYLFMIARNLHVDWRRRQARTDVFAGDPADPSAGPESESGGRSELRLVMRLLQQLPELDRAALLMRTLEEMPFEHRDHSRSFDCCCPSESPSGESAPAGAARARQAGEGV